MLYLALGSFVGAVVLLMLDLFGVTPAAAGFASVLLLVTLFFVGLRGIVVLHHHFHHPQHSLK